MKYRSIFLLIIISVILAACGNEKKATDDTNKNLLSLAQITFAPKATTQRWYFPEQAERGKVIFTDHCRVCHGSQAEATPDWKTPDANGHYPPPPLNGSAHAWHHPMSVLGRTIYNGGAEVGGQMPAFKDKLSETDIIDVIAHFQSYWPDAIYDRWLTIEKPSQ